MLKLDLPEPNAEMQAQSKRLSALVRARIEASPRCSISFAEYFELSQYAPGLGYYSAGMNKLGTGGDFVTAPELGNAFAYCLANALAPTLRALQPKPTSILEIGCGTGKLAVDLLRALAAIDCLPDHYDLLERSADLRARQREYARVELADTPELFARMRWLDAPRSESWCGAIIGNEIVDALPCERFEMCSGEARQLRVAVQNDVLIWQLGEALTLPAGVQEIVAELTDGYQSEYLQLLPAWLASISASMHRGMMIMVDYGYARRDYYHSQRDRGTLVCHYQHRVFDAPFWWPGLVDISASVDFTLLAEAGVAAGFELLGLHTQAEFLLRTGLTELASSVAAFSPAAALKRGNEIRKLTLSSEMGERFLVMSLHKGMAAERMHEVYASLGLRARL
jgi:SAM-dependent MidA family methyltransferase